MDAVHFRQIVPSEDAIPAEVLGGEMHEIASRRERRAECEARAPVSVLHRQRRQNARTQELFVAHADLLRGSQHANVECDVAVTKGTTRRGDESKAPQALAGLRLGLVCILEARCMAQELTQRDLFRSCWVAEVEATVHFQDWSVEICQPFLYEGNHGRCPLRP